MTPDRSWDSTDTMIGVDEALDRILLCFRPLPSVDTPILAALGMVTSVDVVAPVDVPPFRNSAMDGYAVRAVDTSQVPARLRVVGLVAAGSLPARAVEPGQALRIMTGAPMPEGADAVVRFEETDESTRASVDYITIGRPIQPHENVREAGEDIRAGRVVMSAGTVIRPADVGVLASLNMERVSVHRRPRVAILGTGNEVVDLGPELRPGQIRNSNSFTIAAAVRQCGGEPTLLGVARDSTEDLRAKLATAGSPDLIITSGGVSIGDYDMVKDVLRAEGSIEIWQVRMKPGKPLAFGTFGDTVLLGLPGNPAAAYVSFEQFGRPAILTMLGRRDVRLREIVATLTERLANPGRRRHFVRGVVTWTSNGCTVTSTGGHGSGVLTAAARANCFIVVPETREMVDEGSHVRVQLIEGVGTL
jgi:molybdopterin molybdotransferase